MSVAPEIPGTAESPADGVRVRAIYRNADGEIHQEWPPERIAEALSDEAGCLWVDIEDRGNPSDGLAESLLLDVFKFHPLAVEDAIKEAHVPRVDDWGPYLYIVFHSIECDHGGTNLRLHELDIFLGRNFLVTYHTEPLSYLDHDRRNIGRDTENRKVICGHDGSENAAGISFVAQTNHRDIVRRYAGEHGVLIANVRVCRIRKSAECFRILPVLRKHLHELMGPSVTRRGKKHGVNQAEPGRVRANSERENQNRGNREARRFNQLPESKANVSNHIYQM